MFKNETKAEQNKTRQNANQQFLSNWRSFLKTFKRKENRREAKLPPIYYISRAVLFTISINCVSNTNIDINKNYTSEYKQNLTAIPVVCLDS